jgi:molecular chaperone GrpE
MVGSLFRHTERADEPEDDDQAAQTIEVRAEVIAEAASGLSTARSGQAEEQFDPVVAEELLEQALTERGSLVQLCLYALDRARSSGVADRIEEGLAAIGVTALRPDGDRFDPVHHEAGGTVHTDDAEIDGTVAETEVVGFSDRGRLLRAPIVTVYTARSTATS